MKRGRSATFSMRLYYHMFRVSCQRLLLDGFYPVVGFTKKKKERCEKLNTPVQDLFFTCPAPDAVY